MQKIIDEIAKVGVELILQEPFYAHFLSNLNKKIDDTCPTLAVGLEGDMYVLYVNPLFWSEHLTTSELRLGVLKHEILHLVFKHIARRELHHNPLIFNLAVDLVVNQYIPRANLPKSAIFLETFMDLDLEAFQTFEYYYSQLLNIKNENGAKCPQCFNLLKSLEENEDNWIVNNILKELDKHITWKDILSKSMIEKSLTDIQLDNLIRIAIERTGEKGIGKLPLQIQAYLRNILIKNKPEVDWRRSLRIFAETSRKTSIKNTLKKPSKRYGTTPGIKIKRRQRLLIALDTSGSISQDELMVFFSEVYHIWRMGAEIKIVECDIVIGNIYDYKGVTPKLISGGGGTAFNAPIRYANDIYLPDGIIYFTDAYGEQPSVKPRMPMIWIVTKQGANYDNSYFKNLPGRKVKLN